MSEGSASFEGVWRTTAALRRTMARSRMIRFSKIIAAAFRRRQAARSGLSLRCAIVYNYSHCGHKNWRWPTGATSCQNVACGSRVMEDLFALLTGGQPASAPGRAGENFSWTQAVAGAAMPRGGFGPGRSVPHGN